MSKGTNSIRVASACSALLLTLLGACDGREVDPTRPLTPRVASHTIYDGAHGGSSRLYFLPPLVSAPSFSGVFDPTAFAPGSNDQVFVCLLAGTQCASTIATFTAGTGPSGVHMDPATESYQVTWQTRSQQPPLDPSQVYRIVVRVNSVDVGYADVIPVQLGPPTPVDKSQYGMVRIGTALPIAFRLEVGAPAPPPTGMIDLTAGGGYTCALSASGWISCWGLAPSFSAQNLALTPTALVNGNQFKALGRTYAVASNSCAIRVVGGSACWGTNAWGEIGDGSIGGGPFTSPLSVNGPAFTRITSGATHACGLTIDGIAYCWGDNGNGELGDGTTTQRPTPVAVVGGLFFKSISAGAFYTCAVTTAGAAYCWGLPQNGRLGSVNWSVPQSTPLAVSGGLTFNTISTGFFHTCGVTTTGAAYCWGVNFSGQVGNGTTSSEVDLPSAVVNGLVFSDISLGRDHTCAITSAGAGYCWGQNLNGQLGNGSLAQMTAPAPVSGGLTFAQIAAAATHSCGRTSDGSIYCWGANNNGQLGDGTQTQRLLPTLVTFP